MDTLARIANFKSFRYAILDADTRALEFFMLLTTISWSIWLGLGDHTNWPRILDTLQLFGGYKVWTFWGFFHGTIGVLSQLIRYPKYRRIAALCNGFYWSLLSFCILNVDRTMFLCWFAPLIATAEFFIIIRRFTMATGANKK